MGFMYSKLDELELCNSPASARNGLPLTISCVADACFRKWGYVGSGSAARTEMTDVTNTTSAAASFHLIMFPPTAIAPQRNFDLRPKRYRFNSTSPAI